MKHKKIIQKMTAVTLAAVMTASNLCFPEMTNVLDNLHIPSISNFFHKDSDVVHAVIDTTTVNRQETIGSLQALYEFAANYASNYDNYQDGIWRLNITTAEALVLEENHIFNEGRDDEFTMSYQPLGTDSKPFRGVIVVTRQDGNDLVLSENVPFFNSVYDSTEIMQAGTSNRLQVNVSRISSATTYENQPLFARKVFHDSYAGSSAAIWKIFTTGASAYSGLIGEMAEYASVGIELNNTCTGNVVSNGNAGLICGKMGAHSTINVEIAATSVNNYSVTSSGGSAGGLAGEMESESTLYFTIPTANGTPTYDLSEARTIAAGTSGTTYAGGLVGKNNGANVDIRCVSGSHQEETGEVDENDQPIMATVTDYAYVPYTAKGTITAATAAGGIFGYYKATSDTDLTGRYSVGIKATDTAASVPCNVRAAYAGGYVGQLDGGAFSTTFDGAVSSRLSVDVACIGGTQYFGGLVGRYSSTDLTKKFEAKYVDVVASSSGFTGTSAYGGIIGAIGSSDGDSAAYVYADDITINATSGYDKASSFGGIIGDAGTKGSLLDIGKSTITTGGTFTGGGIVGKLSKGVLRLSGITNLTGAECDSASDTNGQIVGGRGDALVYALGTGEDTTATYGSGWALVRSTSDADADDIGTWGEVVRLTSIEDGANDTNGILTYNSSTHTVTVKSAVQSMTSVRDFARTALNMQLNDGGLGALQFTDAKNETTNLMGNKNLSISGSIVLDGTGITGFMRDGGTATSVGTFTGKLTGSSTASVQLAIGERYGLVTENSIDVYGDGDDETTGIGRGAIYAHRYHGLFSRTGDTAEIDDVKILGSMNLNLISDDCYVGGAVAEVTSGINLKGVSAEETINYNIVGGENHYIGGLIGAVSAGNPANSADSPTKGNVTIQKNSNTISIKPTINVSGTLITNDDSDCTQCIGGAIGAVLSTNAFTVSLSDATLTAKIDASSATGCANVGIAGLISDFAYNGAGADDDTRTLTLSNVDSQGTTIKTPPTRSSGGILGYRWFNTNVNLSNVTLSTTVNELDTTAPYVGAMVYRATGHWNIPSAGLAINKLKITKTPASLGIIVHDGYYTESDATSGIFLELTAADSYTLEPSTSSSALIIPVPTKKDSSNNDVPGVYDELCAFTSKDSTTILKNGTSGVISYHTKAVKSGDNTLVAAGTFSMDKTNCNSYQNVYNTTTVNPNSRYYYNLDSSNRTAPTDAWRLLSWSVNRYAAENVKKHFNNAFAQTDSDGQATADLVTGTFDLVNVSYYPIDIDEDVDLGNITVKFYNSSIETTEDKGTTKKKTLENSSGLGTSQQYLMHCGLFKDVTAEINGTGNIHLQGNTGNNAYYTGALICGTLSGTLFTDTSKEVVLEGITLSDSDGFLLINKISSPTDKTQANLYLYGVRVGETGKSPAEVQYTADNATSGVASSLIGAVTGYNVTLDFEKIKLDARKATTYDGDFYGTNKSIFKNATLIDTIDIDANSIAKYYYTYSEDWGGTAPHGVTYGQEINDSVKNSGKQRKYFATGSETKYFTRPDHDPKTVGTGDQPAEPYNAAYSNFSTNYLPYVKNFNTSLASYQCTIHELDVNVMIEGLTEGCGTYNHPYILKNADQMDALYNLLNGSNVVSLRLPISKTLDYWCNGSTADCSECTDCALYTLDGPNYTSTGNVTWTVEEAREYAAGAYYRVEDSFEITSSSFGGLGSVSVGDKYKYAFRGVIVGKNENVTITNKTQSPLIKVSNGCVVRNLSIAVNTSAEVVTGNKTDKEFGYGLGSIFYGGVIGEIMGGDNIIDNVRLSYTNNSGKSLNINSSNGYLSTVGGYVGVIVNGGLIFRNMSTSHFNKANFIVGSNYQAENDTTHLYINPYVGRVINGYAINETTSSYSGDTGTYTLDNSTKNYRIPDINSGSTAKKITFGTYDSKDTIDIQDGQSLFILSLITQSGAGTAKTAGGDYAYAVSYDGTDPFWTSTGNSNAAQYAATHLASYDKVGNTTSADLTNASSDYSKALNDTYGSKRAVPYIIYKYTEGTTVESVTTYKARTITYAKITDTSTGAMESNNFIMRLTTLGGTYNLPDCFRGIGAICTLNAGLQSTSKREGDEDGKYSLHLYGLEGNGATINIKLRYKTYCYDLDNYINTVYGIQEGSNDVKGIHIGFGLFNYLYQARESTSSTYNLKTGYYIGNFKLSGVVSVEEYLVNGTLAVADTEGKKYGNGVNRGKTRHTVGGVTGGMLANDYLNLYKLTLDNLIVSGTSMVGGYVGKNNFTSRDSASGNGRMQFYANCCNTTNLEVSARGGYCAGMTAGYAMGFLDVYINTAPNSGELAGEDGYSKSSMSVSITNQSNCNETGTGGVIGSGRTGLNNIWINNVTLSGVSGKAYIKNTDNTATDSRGVGGFIGYARKAGTIIITNSTVKNIDITGPSVGGVFGFIENQTGSATWGVNPYIRVYNCKVINDEVDDEGNSVEHIIEGKSSAGGITGSFQTGKGSGESCTWDSTGDSKGDKYVLGYDEDSSATKTKYKYDIEGCEVSGYTIAQTSNANSDFGVGGLIGYATNANRTIVNSSVHNCTIKVECSSTKHYMGGIVGYTGNAVSGYNIAAYNNTFSYTTDGTVSATTCGNFIGNANGKAIKIVGFSRKNNTRLGNLVTADYGGTNTGGYIIDSDYTSTFLSDAHNETPANISELPYSFTFNNNSFILSFVGEGAAKNYYPYVNVNPITDLSRTSTDAFLSGDGSALYNRYTKVRAKDENGNYIMDGSNYTYETENGQIVYEATPMPIAQAIIDDITATNTEVKDTINAKYTAYKSGDNTNVSTMLSNALPENNVNSEKDLKLTLYSKEMNLPTGIDDFPIIAIDGSEGVQLSSTTYNYTDYITSYIRLMTNSSFDYTADTDAYRIKIYPCQFDNGKYQIITDGSATAGLSRDSSNRYVMDINNADTTKSNSQFSLIDGQFYNPVGAPLLGSNKSQLKTSGEVAMHLYVPVLTKRMVRFNFYSSLKQGTDYVSTGYAFPNHMAGNFDSWFTMYVKYEYPVAQVDAILAAGRGLKWNSDKTINIAYDGYQDFADSTQFVLLDNNDGIDKEYYLSKSDVTTDGGGTSLATDIIELNKFKTRRSGTTYDDPAQAFSPQFLYQLAGESIRYTVDSTNGKYVEADSEAECTVRAFDEDGKNEMFFRVAESRDSTKTKYTLTGSSAITETYYISVYAYKKDNNLTKNNSTNSSYGFRVTCPLTLSGTLTSKRSNYTESYGFLGEMFVQTLDYSRMNTDTLITPSNNELKATLTATLSFIQNPDGTYNPYNQNMLSQYGIKLFQGFLVYLNRYDDNGKGLSDNRIYGSPSYTYTTQVGNGNTISYSDALDDEANYLYVPPAEAITIPAYVEGTTWVSTQTATVEFEFSEDKDELEDEFFPIRYDGSSVAGIGFHSTANIEYSRDRVEYSNQTFPKDDAKRYHMEQQENAELTLTALDQSTADGYDEYGFNSNNRSSLGINAKYISGGENYSQEGDFEHIDISVNFDVSNLDESTVLDGKHSILYTLKLEQKKNANNAKGYSYEPVSIDSTDSSYLKKNSLSLFTKGANLSRLDTSTAYVYYYKIDLPEDREKWKTDYTAGQFTARLSFDVKTAAELEAITDYVYSNYRISMTANIVTTSEITNIYAGDDDCIVWTNAMVNAKFVTKNTPQGNQEENQNVTP